MAGFVIIDKDIVNWRWFKNANVFRTFMYLLFTANYERRDFEKITIERGQVVTSYPKISDALGITEAQARTAIKNLKTTGEITVNATPKFSVVTIINYDKYQRSDRRDNSQMTDKEQTNDRQITVKSQTDNSQITAIKQYKQENKENNKNNTPLSPKGAGEADSLFERFWEAYPRKAKKQDALRAWKKLKPNEDFVNMLLTALEKFKQTPQWIKDNGQFIPYPASWLNGRRWEEVQDQPLQSPPQVSDFDPADPYATWRGNSNG